MNNQLHDLSEDFEGAYRSRLKEFIYLQKANNKDYEILLMHLGGVIVECYLKYLIVERFEIKKIGFGKGGWFWLSDENADKALLQDGHNLKKETILNFANVERPGHTLRDCFTKIPEFNVLLLPNTILSRKLKNICDPLNTKEGSFIDLRYRDSSCFSNNNTKFQTWLQDFRDILKWIDEQKKYIRVVN